MRVDFVTKEYPPNIYGGAGVHITELVRVLRNQIEARVHAFGDPVSEPLTFGYPVPIGFESSNAALQTLATDLTMVDAIAGADLVHTHTWYANFAGQVAGLLHGIPHVITAHSLEPLRPWKLQQLAGGYRLSSHVERSAYMGAKRIVAVSNGMRRDILQAYPELDPSKVDVVYNGIDSERWFPISDPDVLRSYGVNPDRRYVLFVGRITKQKGLPYLLRAAAELPSDVQLVLCAGAPDNAEILAEVQKLVEELQSKRDGVVWISEHLPQQKLAVFLSSASIFACPSIYEPLGIVNLEAMACGAAVVATATGGIPEVVIDGKTGWLVPIEQESDGSGTPIDAKKFEADWAATLNKALDATDLNVRAEAGKLRAIESFSWASIADLTIEVYRQALAE
jgi:starch synthase